MTGRRNPYYIRTEVKGKGGIRVIDKLSAEFKGIIVIINKDKSISEREFINIIDIIGVISFKERQSVKGDWKLIKG